MATSKVVTHDEWLSVRKGHLTKEKEFTRLRDQLSKERRDLPWELVEKEYVFEGENGRQTLAEIFDGRSQLVACRLPLVACSNLVPSHVVASPELGRSDRLDVSAASYSDTKYDPKSPPNSSPKRAERRLSVLLVRGRPSSPSLISNCVG